MLCGNPQTIVRPFQDQIVACGACMACRINKRRQLTTRGLLEALMYDVPSSFLTLTYSTPNLPQRVCDGLLQATLEGKHWTLFMKRLRFIVGAGIRFLAVGEYGEKFHRPHFHAVLFGLPPSPWLETQVLDAWGMGHISLAECSDERIGYCAAYTVKKLTGTNPKLAGRPPEFTRRSMRPGIGFPFVERLARMYESRRGAFVLSERHDIEGTVRIGPKHWPLDYYMSQHLRKRLNLPRLAVDRPPKPEYDKDYEQAAKKNTLLEINYNRPKTGGSIEVS